MPFCVYPGQLQRPRLLIVETKPPEHSCSGSPHYLRLDPIHPSLPSHPVPSLPFPSPSRPRPTRSSREEEEEEEGGSLSSPWSSCIGAVPHVSYTRASRFRQLEEDGHLGCIHIPWCFGSVKFVNAPQASLHDARSFASCLSEFCLCFQITSIMRQCGRNW